MKSGARNAGLSCGLILGIGLATQASGEGLVRTPWELHEGKAASAREFTVPQMMEADGLVKAVVEHYSPGGPREIPRLNTLLENPRAGSTAEQDYYGVVFSMAVVPDEGTDGWTRLQEAPGVALMDRRSSMPCRGGVDYTYFQTFVSVPAGATVELFEIDLADMDDAIRVSVFPHDRDDTAFNPDRHVPLRTPKTANLKDAITPGTTNRIVLTLVDICGGGNKLGKADVRMALAGEGAAVVEVSTAAPRGEPEPTPAQCPAPAAAVPAATVSHGAWEMHHGQAAFAVPGLKWLSDSPDMPRIRYFRNLFSRAEVPAIGDDGWEPAPDSRIIGFNPGSSAEMRALGCLGGLDYTYFQTFVTVPEGSSVSDFRIAFEGMDDASRVSIARRGADGAWSEPQDVAGSYVFVGETRRANLSDLVKQAGYYRVVVSQVDMCPPGNTLNAATITLNGSVVQGTGVATADCPATVVPAAVVREAKGYFRLTNLAYEAEDRCFEGNRLADDAYIRGAAFLDRCQNVSGQYWQAVPWNDEQFLLKTMFQGEERCFEASRIAESATLGGAGHMAACSGAGNQLWTAVPAPGHEGYLSLKTRLSGEELCLVGNRPGDSAPVGGGAYLAACASTNAEMWKILDGALIDRIPEGRL